MCRGVGRARRPTKPTTVPPPCGTGAASQCSNTTLPAAYTRVKSRVGLVQAPRRALEKAPGGAVIQLRCKLSASDH